MSQTTVLPGIDFQNIRPHRGTRHGGFEELAVQLFRASIAGAAVELRGRGQASTLGFLNSGLSPEAMKVEA